MLPSKTTQPDTPAIPLAEQCRAKVDAYKSNYEPKYNEIIKEILTTAEKGEATTIKYAPACWYDGICMRLMEDGFYIKMESNVDKDASSTHKIDIAW